MIQNFFALLITTIPNYRQCNFIVPTEAVRSHYPSNPCDLNGHVACDSSAWGAVVIVYLMLGLIRQSTHYKI